MGKITTKKRILFSFRGQVTINGQIMSEKPGIFCAQNGQKLWVFGQPEGQGIRGQLDHDQRHLIPPAVGGEKGGLQTPEQAGCHGGAVSARQYPVPFGIVIVPKNL